MMKIKPFAVGYLSTNCYLLSGEDGHAVLIDAGGGYEKISAYLLENGLTLDALLLTHGHFDHIAHAGEFQRDGVKLFIHAADAEMLSGKWSLAKEVGIDLQPMQADVLISDGDILSFGEDISMKVIHTPGHTEGCCSFLVNNAHLFTGDTLFLESHGRTDFPGGSPSKMRASLQKLFALPGDYPVYPGHEESTTLKHEREYYPNYV